LTDEPEQIAGGEADHVAAYLRFYRETVVAKCRTLPDAELRRPRLPSGWTPLELLQHLAYMERRWFQWGFLGEPVDAPWGDNAGAERDAGWQVTPETSLDDVVALLDRVAVRTEEVLATSALEDAAATGGRFRAGPGMPAVPTLRWICFHVLQEYARHAGHLDVVVELAGGPTGE
jgi:uncharacterized damage-inducible protein DinB